MNRKIKKILLLVLAVLCLCTAAMGIYASDYYHADEAAIEALKSTDAVSVEITDGMAVFCPETIESAFVFYPGGKVEYTAYAPLMKKLAENNIACIITKMPLNLAVMDINAADKAYERIADADRWYIGGHSLGGSMAASYIDSTEKDFDGLVLLASYSTADLTDNSMDVLSVYGSDDGVLNMEKYDEYYSNLPDTTEELVISGGNHAQFGSYGEQKSDGMAVVSSDKQQDVTAEAIIRFIKE